MEKGRHELVRTGGDDRAALDDFSGVRVGARCPEAGEPEQLVARQVEVDRVLLPIASERPLIKAVRRDEATMAAEQPTVCRLLGQRLRSSVDHLEGDLLSFAQWVAAPTSR